MPWVCFCESWIRLQLFGAKTRDKQQRSCLHCGALCRNNGDEVGWFPLSYRGSCDDLPAFGTKFSVVAGLQNWDTDGKKADNMLLFLEDEAFTVWSEISDSDKKDPDKVKEHLSAAFDVISAAAYRMFGMRALRAGESIDNYAADLKKNC